MQDVDAPYLLQRLGLQKLGIGQEDGFSMPEVQLLSVTPALPSNIEKLRHLGIEVNGRLGSDNFILHDERQPLRRCVINFSGVRNVVVLQPNPQIQARLNIYGDNCTAIFDGKSGHSNVSVTFRGDSGIFYWGKDCTSNGLTCVVQGPNGNVAFGHDCMLSSEIIVRATDSHGLVDLPSLSVFNPAASIKVGPHAWIGQQAMLMKGVKIGRGAVVGARSTVTSEVADRSLAVGTPAKIIRSNITWTRDPEPNMEELKSAAKIAGYADV